MSKIETKLKSNCAKIFIQTLKKMSSNGLKMKKSTKKSRQKSINSQLKKSIVTILNIDYLIIFKSFISVFQS